MCEHAPNVCVKALLEELKLGGHLEHLSSPRQFDRTEGLFGDLWNASDNAKLVIGKQQIIDDLKIQNALLTQTITELRSFVELYKNEQKEGCKTLGLMKRMESCKSA
jgi:hypothetical protein